MSKYGQNFNKKYLDMLLFQIFKLIKLRWFFFLAFKKLTGNNVNKKRNRLCKWGYDLWSFLLDL